jgi:hypothetical protein
MLESLLEYYFDAKHLTTYSLTGAIGIIIVIKMWVRGIVKNIFIIFSNYSVKLKKSFGLV